MGKTRRFFLSMFGACAMSSLAAKAEELRHSNKWQFHSYRFKGESKEQCLEMAKILLRFHTGNDVAMVSNPPGSAEYIDALTGEREYVGWVFFSVLKNPSDSDREAIEFADRVSPLVSKDPGALVKYGGVVDSLVDYPFVNIPDIKLTSGV